VLQLDDHEASAMLSRHKNMPRPEFEREKEWTAPHLIGVANWCWVNSGWINEWNWIGGCFCLAMVNYMQGKVVHGNTERVDICQVIIPTKKWKELVLIRWRLNDVDLYACINGLAEIKRGTECDVSSCFAGMRGDVFQCAHLPWCIHARSSI
jgi:hypothetical protein